MMKGSTLSFLLASAGLLGANAFGSAFGCADPVHDHEVTELGKETSGVPIGEFHRAGQPCGECHQSTGPASSTFSVAGTVFASPTSYVGVYEAEVQMTDSVGTQYIAVTNCVGNFFVKPTDWDPKFPILVRVRKGPTALTMLGPIGREVSCSACHKLKLGYDEARQFMPHIALFGGDEPAPTLPEAGCPVNPDLGTP